RLYLLPETQARYVAAMRDLLATAWNEPALTGEADRMAAVIQPLAGRDLTADVQGVRDFITNRRASIVNEQTPNPPAWTTPLKLPTVVGLVTDGTLHLDAATMTDGAAITGTFSGHVLSLAP